MHPCGGPQVDPMDDRPQLAVFQLAVSLEPSMAMFPFPGGPRALRACCCWQAGRDQLALHGLEALWAAAKCGGHGSARGPELPVVQRNAAELKVSKEVVATILEDFLELPLCEAPAPDPEEGSP